MLAAIVVAVVVTAASVAYSIQQAKKLRAAARAAAEARKGFEVVVSNSVQPIPLIYGRAKIGGTRVWHGIKASHTVPPNYVSNANKVFEISNPGKPGLSVTFESEAGLTTEVVSQGTPSSSLSNSINGTKNEFLYYQQVLCHGPINRVIDFVIDESRFANDPELTDSKSKSAFRTEVSYDGGVANNLIAANFSERNLSEFPGIAYASTIVKLNRDDPQFSGQVPSVQYFIEGRKVRKLIRSGLPGNFVYTLSERVYSNNPAWCLLDYLLASNRNFSKGALFEAGKNLSTDLIDLESFYNAAAICDTIVLNDKPVYGIMWQSVSPGQNVLTRNIPLYECNIIIDVEKPIRDNIESILSTMGDARLIWSSGKYKLSLQYPTSNSNIKLAATLTDDDLLQNQDVLITWPSTSDKFNFAKVTFHNESENFKETEVTWPPKKSGTVYKGVGGSRYPATEAGVESSLLSSYAVWSGSESSSQMTWKYRALESGVYTLKFQCDDYGVIEIRAGNSVIHTASINGYKNVSTTSVTLNANTIYTINIEAGDTGGAKGAAATLVKSNIIYWTTRDIAYSDYEVYTQSSAVYDEMKAEDSGLELETNIFLEGCVDYYHALAKAEELVRTSRSALKVKFKYVVKDKFLEPGDIVKIESSLVKVTNDLYVRINEVKLQENSVCEVSGSRFDYTQLAWNVADDEYIRPTEKFAFSIPAPTNFKFVPEESVLADSSGTLTWDPVSFEGLQGYILYGLFLENLDSNGNIVPAEIGRTSDTKFLIPKLSVSAAVFGIRSVSKNGSVSDMVLTGDASIALFKGKAPPKPTNLAVQSDTTKAKILLTWTIPAERSDGSKYEDHLVTNIYRSIGSDNFADATLLGSSYSSEYSDLDEQFGLVRYWIQFVTSRNVYGEFSEPSPTIEFIHLGGSVNGTQLPPAPFNLVATPSFKTIILSWENPQYSYSGGHLKSFIYAKKSDETVPLISTSTLVGASEVPYFVFSADISETWTFWVKEVSVANTVSASYAGPVTATTTKIGNTDLGPLVVEAENIANNSISNQQLIPNLEAVYYYTGASLPTSNISNMISWEGKLYKWDTDSYKPVVNAIDLSGILPIEKIPDSALDITKFASSIRPVEILDALPTTDNSEGRIVYLTTDGKLYRYLNNSFSAAVPTTDLTGTISADQIAANAIIAGKIAAGAVSTTELAANAVTAAKIAAGTITADKIAANSITADKIAANAITASELSANAVTADKIAANAITSDKIAANTITASEIATGAIVADKLAAGAIAVGTAAIANGAITNAMIGNLAADKITTGYLAAARLQAGTITAASGIIADAAVNTLKIAGNSVTVSTYAQGYLSGPTITTSYTTVCSTSVSISGLASGQTAGTIITANTVLYAGASDGAVVAAHLFVNGSDYGNSACSLGESKTITTNAFVGLANGSHTIELKIRTEPGSGGASSKPMTSVVGYMTIISGKR